MPTEISRSLLEWYDLHARRLPWRGQIDPYAVWVSEIMLQQTQVETVIPYFLRWMERFPTLRALAEADEQAVLQSWEGLGYYSRARNLHKAARQVLRENDGHLPQTRSELERLPGIGPYTAAAIASIAFGQSEAALDGNIRRIYARLYALRLPLRSKEAAAFLLEYATLNLPAERAGDYNQALMDLGAGICNPRNPLCQTCPLSGYCLACIQGAQGQIPIRVVRPRIPHLTVTAAVLQRDGKVLIDQRPPDGLLGGLWEFPGGKVESGETLQQGLQRELREELGVEVEVGPDFGIYRHAYTHFRVTVHTFLCSLAGGEPQPIQPADIRWVHPGELSNFPMGKIDRQIASRIARESGSA